MPRVLWILFLLISCIFTQNPGEPGKPTPVDYTPIIILSVGCGLLFTVTTLIFIYASYVRHVNNKLFNQWQHHLENGGDFEFKNIRYTLRTNMLLNKKHILHGISASIPKGSMVAIMGASGSGKTTLLDILAGRNKTGSVYGTILYNGKPRNIAFHRISGYVMQDDLLMPTMTVREVLNFVAQLRLPEYLSSQEKQKRIDDAMEDLGIKHLANRRIGGTFKRGISGGEKKRVSIACELIASPNLLFLDEPTSGLDSYNAYKVMSCLSKLSKKGTTVIFSIHQPRSSVFELFDYLLVLAEGHMTYFGKASNVLEHFTNIGYKVPSDYNIPDFIIDVMESASRNVKEKGTLISRELQSIINSYWRTVEKEEKNSPRMASQLQHSDDEEYVKITKDDIADYTEEDQLLDSNWEVRVEPPIDIYSTLPSEELKYRYMTSFAKQFLVLARRAFLNFLRNIFLMPAHFLVSILMGLFLGYVYYDLGVNLVAIQNRIGAFFFSCIVLALGAMTSLELFITERAIFVREIANAYYHPLAYYLSKIIFDVIPLRVIPPIFMGTISYWMMGLRGDLYYFFWFLLLLIIFNIVSGGVCLVIGALITSTSFANLVTIAFVLYSMLFGGFFINNSSTSWIKYLSPFQFCIEALMTNELKGRWWIFDPERLPPTDVTGEQILDFFGMVPSNFNIDVIALCGMAVFYIVLAGVVVYVFARERR